MCAFGRTVARYTASSKHWPKRIHPCYAESMKVSAVLRMLQDDGWFLVATRGSHRQFKHAQKPGRVTYRVSQATISDLAP